MMNEIYNYQAELARHPMYQGLNSIEAIRKFMSTHVYAVWDFMSLLKSLQVKLTCVEVPWTPSSYAPEVVRLINQIVLGEESDVDPDGNAISHFELYLRGMEEVGASTDNIRDFINTLNTDIIPFPARDFVVDNIDVAKNGHIVEVAAYFFYGREKLIPDMFQSIVKVLELEKINAPTFLYYLKRHIEVDGNEHGPLALKCLDHLTAGNNELKKMAKEAGMRALKSRNLLWTRVMEA